MSKLRTIREAFDRNPNIVVLGPNERKSFGEGYSSGLNHDSHTLVYVQQLQKQGFIQFLN